jgi:hypothetical protein
MLMLAVWWSATRNRVTQRNMRIFLQAEQAFMLVGITIRFLQDAFLPYFYQDIFLYQNTFIMRLSFYISVIPMIFLPLLGFYASFGLGRSEDYRFNPKWYCLLIPAVVLALFTLTNENHHLIFRPLEEAQSNRYYHPNTGFYIIIAWAFLLLFIRMVLIYTRSREMQDFSHLRNTPFLIAVFILLYNIPYVSKSYMMDFELFDYYVFLFYLEAMIWEISTLAGMVPVNTSYEEVFDRSTVAMQIVDEEGRSHRKSAVAPELSTEMFHLLKQQTTVLTKSGLELHIHGIRGGYAVWQSDVSQTVAVREELHESVEKLKPEEELLHQELMVKSNEAAVKEQNLIYNRLTDEVGGQLLLLRDLLKEQRQVTDNVALFKKICLIGTYIKRRCNLRLIEQTDGHIENNELELCFSDMVSYLQHMGVSVNILWDQLKPLDPEFTIFVFDVFEFLLEHEDFDLHSVRIAFEADSSFSIQLHKSGDSNVIIPVDGIQRINKMNNTIRWQKFDNGYQISVLIGE